MDEHLKKIQSDVDAMNKTFEQGEVSTDPPEVKTDPPSTDPPFEDEVKTDPPSTDQPKTDPPTTDAPDDRDKSIEELRRKLAEKDEVKTDPPKTSPPATSAPIEPKDFVGDLDPEDLSPEELNKLLNKTYQQAIRDAQEQDGVAAQQLPEYVAAVIALQKSVDSFYNENEDLKPYKKDVAKTFEKVRLANPNKTYEELTAETAIQTRKHLELPEPSNKKVDKGNPPRLPRKKSKPGKTKDKSEQDPMSSDIEAMNKSLGR